MKRRLVFYKNNMEISKLPLPTTMCVNSSQPFPQFHFSPPALHTNISSIPTQMQIFQRNLEIHANAGMPLFLSPYLPNQFFPPVNQLSLFTIQQNMLKFHQLQKAFQSGVEQDEQRLGQTHLTSRSQNQQSNYRSEETTIEKHQSESRSKVQADVISQWDPWFHRRIKKNVKKDAKFVKGSPQRQNRVMKNIHRKEIKVIHSLPVGQILAKGKNLGNVNSNTSSKRSSTESPDIDENKRINFKCERKSVNKVTAPEKISVLKRYRKRPMDNKGCKNLKTHKTCDLSPTDDVITHED